MSMLPRWLDTSNEFVVRKDGIGLHLVNVHGRPVALTREQMIRLGLWALVVAGVTPEQFADLVNQVKR